MNTSVLPNFYQYKVIASTNDPSSPIETVYFITVSREAICKEIVAKNLPLNCSLCDTAENMARGKCREIFSKPGALELCKFLSTPMLISEEDERRFEGRDVIIAKQIATR